MKPDVTLELLHTINPVPQPDGLAGNLGVEDDALLLLIEERSVAMSTNTEREATKGIPALDGTADRGTRVKAANRRGWRIAATAFVVVLVVGAAAAFVAMRGSSTPVAATSVSLVGGEVTSNFDDEMGWAFANENLNRMRSPGPLLEVVVGTEVTLTFTNRGGWSQDADGFRDRAIPHSFRVVPSVPSPETMWGADTGLIEPDASATITFTPTEVGDYRYVSDGLGAAGQGMFGRFVVVEATESEPAADSQ